VSTATMPWERPCAIEQSLLKSQAASHERKPTDMRTGR
jgi:hypothetical protein